MEISILCTESRHPVNNYLNKWCGSVQKSHNVTIVRDKSELNSGDLLFLISCHEMISLEIRSNYKKTLVIHSSRLPEGRGWSPQVWQILDGKTEIFVTLLEAEDDVDSGDIWKQVCVEIEKHELVDQINEKLFSCWIELMDFAVKNFYSIIPFPQHHSKATYLPKRTPEDSLLDVNDSIANQFDLLRISDYERYPAHFKLHGKTYKLKIERM